MRVPPAFLVLLPCVTVAGCGPSVTAPPLDVRPVEREPVALPAPEREPALATDPALAAALAAQVSAAEAGDRRFGALRGEAERAAGGSAGAAPGSEAWIAAQQALTALVAARGPVKDAAQAVEALRLAPANAGATARAMVEAAARRIDALDAGEEAGVAALSARLSGAAPRG